MKSLIIAALAISGSLVFADILRPVDVKTSSIVGPEAQQMYSSLGTPDIPGDSLISEFSTYRVERAADGLTQTICEATHYTAAKPSKTEYRCTIQTSTNGAPVPVFVAPRRLG